MDYGFGLLHGFFAGFWTQRGDSNGGRARIAVGTQGQYTIIIPSMELVIVKMGWAQTPSDDIDAVARLVKNTISAFGLN
jgi:hypothetical protein